MKIRSMHTVSIFLLCILLGFFFVSVSITAEAGASRNNSESRSGSGSHSAPESVSSPTGRTIRVAQVDLSNFYDYNRQGPVGGYGFDYLETISHYTGWNYDYIPVTFEQGLEMLDAGEIDLFHEHVGH